jgi:hypothetical protein
MAGKKITELQNLPSASGNNLLVVVDNNSPVSVTKNITIQQFAAQISGSGIV